MQRNNLSELLVKYKGNDQETNLDKALRRAAAFGSVGDIEILIASGASLESQGSDGRTALHWAIAKERADVVEFLISKGAPTHITDRNGDTCAQLAAKSKNKDVQNKISALQKKTFQTNNRISPQVHISTNYSGHVNNNAQANNENGFISVITFPLAFAEELDDNFAIFGLIASSMGEKLQYPEKGRSMRFERDEEEYITKATITMSLITPHDITINSIQNRVTLNKLLNESLHENYLKTRVKLIQVGEVEFSSSPSTMKYEFDDRIEYTGMEYEGANETPSVVTCNKLNIFGKSNLMAGPCKYEHDGMGRLIHCRYQYINYSQQNAHQPVNLKALYQLINSMPTLFANQQAPKEIFSKQAETSAPVTFASTIVANTPTCTPSKTGTVQNQQSVQLEKNANLINEIEKYQEEYADLRYSLSVIGTTCKNGTEAIKNLKEMLTKLKEIKNKLQSIKDLDLLDTVDKNNCEKLYNNIWKLLDDLTNTITIFKNIVKSNKSLLNDVNSYLINKDITGVVFGFLDDNGKKRASTVCNTWYSTIRNPEITSSLLKVLIENELLSMRAALILERAKFSSYDSFIQNDILYYPQHAEKLLVKEHLPISLFTDIARAPFGGVTSISENAQDIKRFLALCPEAINILKRICPAYSQMILENSEILLQELSKHNFTVLDFLTNDEAVDAFVCYIEFKNTNWLDLMRSNNNHYRQNK